MPPSINASLGAVINADTLGLVWGKAENTQHAQASTVKYMTGLLACELGTMATNVTVASSLFPSPMGSKAGLVNGEVITLENLVYGLMFPSGNDAANIIADHIGDILGGVGGITRFIIQMNTRAETLGLTNTAFINAHGQDAVGQYMSALDLAKLAAAAQANATFAEILNDRIKWIDLATDHRWDNLGGLLQNYAGTLASKGGSTNGVVAHAAVAQRGGLRLAAAVMHDVGTATIYADLRAMLDYGFAQAGILNTATVRVEEAAKDIVYTGAWTRSGYFPNAYSDGFAYYSTATGAKAVFSFTGHKVDFYAFKSPRRGIAGIYIDGVFAVNVDAYAASAAFSSLVYTRTWATPGTHTIEVRNTGTKNAASSGYLVEVDKFIVDDRVA